ncbi:MAG: phage minor head protein [Defluviitaleaceae bacterium]|nr:phage minor head protein [Defluviitaleaceae bacterium]MCL2273429.1 phage minor head protein [Defluviitaleaceae bacterium]
MSNHRDEQLGMFNAFENRVAQAEQNIVRNYAVTLLDYKRHMGNLFERYETNGVLTRDTMAQYGRQGRMNDALRGINVSLYKENTRVIANAVNMAYTSGFTGTSEIVTRAWGQNALHGIIRQEELDRALTNDISGLAWTERMNMHRDTAVLKIRETINQGLREDESYSQMAQRLNESLGRDTVNAIRIVRTECYRVFAEARKDRLDRVTGINMVKTWITSIDERVRKTHVAMHNVSVPYNNNFLLPSGASGFGPAMIGVAAEDINCRCFFVVDLANETSGGDNMDIPDITGDADGADGEVFSLDDTLAAMREDAAHLPEHIRAHYEPHLHEGTFVIDNEMRSALNFQGENGTIFINPSHPAFGEYDPLESIAHEIGHKIDREVIQSHANRQFIDSLNDAQGLFNQDRTRFEGMLDDDDVYYNMSVSDLFSALSRGELSGAFHHDANYWSEPGKVEAEVFADVFAAVTRNAAAYKLIAEEFPSLLNSVHNMLGG